MQSSGEPAQAEGAHLHLLELGGGADGMERASSSLPCWGLLLPPDGGRGKSVGGCRGAKEKVLPGLYCFRLPGRARIAPC